LSETNAPSRGAVGLGAKPAIPFTKVIHPANYLMILPVRHFRLDDHRVAIEGAFAEHLRLMRSKIGETASQLVVGSPLMASAAYERSKRSLSVIDEEREKITFHNLFDDDDLRSWRDRIRLFWPAMRSVYRLVRQSFWVHSGLSWDMRLPIEFAAIIFGLIFRRRTVFVVDIDYRNSALMSYRNGDWSLKNYLACKYLYDVGRSAQVRLATRFCSLVLLKGEKMVKDFGKGRPTVKNILDASHSERYIIDHGSLAEKLRAIRRVDCPLKLTYFGRLTAYKGVDLCIRAVANARRAKGNVTLDIIGEGEEIETLRRLTDTLKVGEYVAFHGARVFDQEFFRFLYRFHLLLAAPLREDTPRNVLDAMAAGIPYLAFDTYYYRQLLESGAGAIVAWPDVDAMTRSLIDLERNRDKIVKMVENAIAFARLNTQEEWLKRRLTWTMGSNPILGALSPSETLS
jgi:glycosyltransferase involved in cell wall biosynthesis